MRFGITQSEINAVSSPVVTTAFLASLSFKSETVYVWTGEGSIMVTGSGDVGLDGNTFDAIGQGIIDISENTYTQNGSDELTISIGIPAAPNPALSAAEVYPSEYRSRPFVMWRALLLINPNPLAQPVWMFRRVRSGKMDSVSITNDGQSNIFKLTVESHQANTGNASNQTYLNQRRYDPNDSSQDFAVSIANGQPAPAAASALMANRYGSAGGAQLYDKLGNKLD